MTSIIENAESQETKPVCKIVNMYSIVVKARVVEHETLTVMHMTHCHVILMEYV